MTKELDGQALKLHEKTRGKIEIRSKVPLKKQRDLALAYTPGVAAPCREIEKHPDLVYRYTSRWNTVAVVTDGTAVLGLGDIGPEAALPVMEGKAILFKEFGGVDAIPLCIASRDVGEIVRAVQLVAPTFGGINLEDISSPRCFEIEERLKATLDIPVFHDDQHGTAVVVLAALLNAVKLTGRKMGEISVVINGAGAAGVAVTRFLHGAGVRRIFLCDRSGPIHRRRKENMNAAKRDILPLLADHPGGTLEDVMSGADVCIGLSGPGTIFPSMVRKMNADAIVFAMANPVPEIMPEQARRAGAAVVGTGRSDFANQINNLLAFPGIFRGALDARARAITEDMKRAASRAIAECVPEGKLNPDYIIPSPLDRNVGRAVAEAVRKSAETVRRTA